MSDPPGILMNKLTSEISTITTTIKLSSIQPTSSSSDSESEVISFVILGETHAKILHTCRDILFQEEGRYVVCTYI